VVIWCEISHFCGKTIEILEHWKKLEVQFFFQNFFHILTSKKNLVRVFGKKIVGPDAYKFFSMMIFLNFFLLFAAEIEPKIWNFHFFSSHAWSKNGASSFFLSKTVGI